MRPYEKIATRRHHCGLCGWSIKAGDPVVPFHDGAAHYDCVDLEFYALYQAEGAHPGPRGGV